MVTSGFAQRVGGDLHVGIAPAPSRLSRMIVSEAFGHRGVQFEDQRREMRIERARELKRVAGCASRGVGPRTERRDAQRLR